MVYGLKFIVYSFKKWWPWLGYFLIFGLAFLIFLYILLPPGILCPDSFYHTKFALLMKDRGIIQNFPWTQFTTYRDLFVDHHLGYHLLLIPFLNLPTPKPLDYFSAEIDPLIKTKLATAFFAGLVFLFIYWFLRRFKIKGAFLYALLTFLVAPFLTRLSFTRAPVVSVIVFVLGLYFIIRRKYLGLFLLSFIYVWLYGAWPIILLAVLIYCLASAIKNFIDQRPESLKFKKEEIKSKNDNPKLKNFKFLIAIFHFLRRFFSKANLKLLFTCLSGLILGLIINPYFPKTFPFNWFQIIKIAAINYHQKIGVGAEWYPFPAEDLILNTLPILIPWLISLAWFIFTIKKQKTGSWFLFLLSIFFFIYTAKARRQIEYFTPTAIFFIAFTLENFFHQLNWIEIKDRFRNLFSEPLLKSVKIPGQVFSLFVSICLFFILLFFFGFYFNQSIIDLHQAYQKGQPLDSFQQASTWLKKNVPAGEIIYQSNWSIFPMLFYFNDQNYYLNGLDQTFFYAKSPELYQKWEDLYFGRVEPSQVAKIIKNDFSANYILADLEDEKFVNLLKRARGIKEVYSDKEAKIYQIEK